MTRFTTALSLAFIMTTGATFASGTVDPSHALANLSADQLDALASVLTGTTR